MGNAKQTPQERLGIPIDPSHIEDERFGAALQLLSEAPVGMILECRDATIFTLNDRMCDWLGYEREQLFGRPLELIVVEEERKHLRERIELKARGKLRAFATVLERRDGTAFPVLWVPQLFERAGWEEILGSNIVLELSTLQTAALPHDAGAEHVCQTLDRVALELQTMSVVLATSKTSPIRLDHDMLSELSPREREVLGQLTEGRRVPAIASSLHISQDTVRSHLKAMYRKLGVSSQSELIEHVRGLSAG